MFETANGIITEDGKTVQKELNDLIQRLSGGTLSPNPIYLTETASSIVGTYKQLSYTMPATETILSTVVNNNEVLINTYIFDLPVGTTILNAGEWLMEIYSYVSQTTLLTKYKIVVFKRTSGGVETDLFTINSNDINNLSVGEVNFESYQNDFSVNATDYLGMRLYANTTASINITVHTYIGDGHPSYVITPLAERHDLLRGLKYTTSNETGYSHLSNGADTIYGIKTFSSFPITPSSAPTTDYQTANKKYVDEISIVGSFLNIKAGLTSDGTSVSYTADSIIVGTALNGLTKKLTSYSQTFNGATTGAGGMDTGSIPTSGFLAIYAIYGTAGASILGVNAATSSGVVYSGANMPAGYTYSALIGIIRTNASNQISIFCQIDKQYKTSQTTVLSSGSATSATAIDLSAVVPNVAKKADLYITSNANDYTYIGSDSTTNIGQVVSYGTNIRMTTEIVILVAQTIYYKVSAGSATIYNIGYSW